MGRRSTMTVLLRVGAFAACAQLAVAYPFVAAAQQPPAGAQQPAGPAAQQPAPPAAPGAPAAQAPGRGRGRGPQPIDARVQIRTHRFAETNEDIPYALFVSSKVKKDQKAPMIVTLHGLGGTHTTMMRPNAIDLAEAGGYILLAPMGYNPRGWFGAPAPQGRRGAPPTNAAPNAAAPNAGAPNPAAPNQTAANQTAAPQGRRGGAPGGLTNANDPPNLRELSEKEALQVIDLVRKEFTVDDNRTYVMGHSMGGAGTLYLAIKYPQRWAAAAAIAPAAFSVDQEGLSKIPKMPIMVVHGDMDTVVPTSVGRAWADAMKALNMNHQYIEVPGGDHGSVISSHQADIFAFFAKHSR